MILHIEEASQWRRRASHVLPVNLPPYTLTDARGRKIEITPFAAWYKNICVLGQDWIPFTSDGAAVIEGMIHTPWLYLGRKRVKQDGEDWTVDPGPMTRIPGRALLLGGGSNYYHWLCDYLPRLILIRRYLPGDVQLLVQKNIQSFQVRSLELLGFPASRLIKIDDNEAVHASELLIPTLLSSTTVVHPQLPFLVKAAFKTGSEKISRKIYLSRQDANSRRLVNEDELIALLASHGFEIHVPGLLAFDLQLKLCSEASVIFAVHGAAMANMIFAQPGCSIIEVSCSKYRVSSMKILAKMCGHVHEEVNAEVCVASADGNPLLGDWRIDLDQVGALLAEKFRAR